AFVALLETLTWLLAVPDSQTLKPFHYISNALFLSLDTLLAAFGLRYLDYKIFVSKKKNRKNFFLYLAPVYLNIGFMIYNLFSDGFLFRVDAANQYHRGNATYIGNISAYLVTIIVVLYFFSHRQMITGRITQTILCLTLLPIIGVIFQMLFYGLSAGIPAYTLAIFISFLLLERDELLKDPLTQLDSRIQMEHRLQFKLKSQESFTAIIADVNDFKKINDIYGHTIGDKVLKDISGILLSHANLEDFVCRYGGDEFFIILESVDNIGHSYIQKIDQALLAYSSHNPYPTTLSYGLLYVDHPVKFTMEELIRLTDQRMYEDKIRRKR
ncbi:MAG TPA: diguanylate cyclase, partial [Lachnospiraceae bacterium]|nr:diguanylate cyclase [Lachnospiraceae bacterium]